MAELRLGERKFGFSVRSLMAIFFSVTACYMSVKKILPTEAFMALASTVVFAYFKREEVKQEQK